jgi:hypothetical protein
MVFAVWYLAVVWLAKGDFFAAGKLPPRVPLALFSTLIFGYAVLSFGSARAAIRAIPTEGLIAVQFFRILCGLFLIRYATGDLPGLFAIPAGVGDVITGLAAPIVAYLLRLKKPYARRAAIAWNIFGMLDLINAVALGVALGGAGIAFPFVLIPVYGVPRAFLMHSYSLLGLLRGAPARSRTAEAGAGA